MGDRYAEERVVIGIGSLLLDRPLEFHHPVGTPVTRLRPRAPDSVMSEPSRYAIHSDGSDASQADDEDHDSDNVGKRGGKVQYKTPTVPALRCFTQTVQR